MQTAGGVDDEDIGSPCLRSAHGIEQDGGGVAALLGFDHLDPRALTPDLQLFDGRRAEGIGRAKQNRLALATEVAGQFPRGRGLAGTVHPHHHDDERRRCEAGFEEILFLPRIQDGLDFLF